MRPSAALLDERGRSQLTPLGGLVWCLLALACAPAPAATPSLQALRPPSVPATRSTADCADLVARVRAHPDSFKPARPESTTLAVPPWEGVPPGWGGRRIVATLLVDEQGKVVADSTRLAPALPPGRYDKAFRETISKNRFNPAVLDGCAVPGRAEITFLLSHRV